MKLDLQIIDSQGNEANEKFFIQGPSLTGLNAVDGSGVVGAGATGTAVYTFVPTDAAAAMGPTEYSLSGTLSYLDPDTDQEVIIPLASSTFTVLPNPKLVLNYFMQRDVIGDDPFTPEVEPSEPFTLGLLATNLGKGTANDFTITSAQPKIVENEKGLLIDFKIIGSQVGNQPTAPSLTVNLGDLGSGHSQVATWSLTSTLAGQFVDYSATFTHDEALGGQRTSIIDSVAIHELIHVVRANRPGDDDLTDFLVNDAHDPDGVPDTLYLSDGTIAPVSLATSISTDGPVSASHRQVHLTANQASGWSYLQLPDPGAGWKLTRVVRSDGTEILVGPDAWQTDKVLNTTTNRFDSAPRLHLLDFDGTGSYTLYYAKNESTPPTVSQIAPVTPDPRNAAVDSVDVTFSEEIDPATFDYHVLSLTRDGGPNLITSAVVIAPVAGTTATCRISGLSALTAADGSYTLTVSAAGVRDLNENAGVGSASIDWSNGTAPPYVKQIVPISPSIRNTPVDTVDVQLSLPIDPASFTPAALRLTRDGQSVALPAGVTVTALDGTGTSFKIAGLSAATNAEGNYSLTVDASAFQGTNGLTGLGTKSAGWVMDTTTPRLLSVEQPQSPRNIVVRSFDVTFSEPIDLSTFDRLHLELRRDGTLLTLDDRVTIKAVGGSVYQITGLNWFMGLQGNYTLTVHGGGVRDLAGNVGSGDASATWVLDTTRPAAPTDVTLTPDRGVSDADGLTNTRQITILGSAAEAGLNVRVYDNTTGHEIAFAAANGLHFSIPVNLVSVGHHVLWVKAVDAAGNVSDKVVLDLFIDETPPAVKQINGVPTGPTTSPVDTVTVVFSKPIDPAAFDYHALSLTLNGGPNRIDGSVTISRIDDTTYTISGLTALTSAPGSYTLTFDSTRVKDLAGNVGQAPFTVSWTTIAPDTIAPTSSATAPAIVHGSAFTVQWTGQDNEGGSGIAYFDVYASVDGGPFTLWKSHTAANSAIFTGTDQHTYGFFSVATDLAGNREAMKTAAESTTFVSIRGEIHGRVFEDVNQTGTDSASAENGLQGWIVFLDLQNDGQLDPGDPWTTTAADGSFVFTNLESGIYHVAEIVQPGWQMTYPTSGTASQSVSVLVGASTAPVYLTDYQPNGSMSSTASSTASNQALIGLDRFRTDPRFSEINGQGYTVVVLDTGVDATHPFFGPIGTDGLASGIAYQYNFLDNTTNAIDVFGHGTLVSSIIASRDVTDRGIAPGVQIIDLKVLDDSGKGDFGTVGRALQWVADNAALYNIVAVNMSFGDGGNYAQPLSRYGMGDVLARLAQENVIVVSAAGNNFYGAQGAPGIAYPATDPNTLPVGAVWASNLTGPFFWKNGAIDYDAKADQIISFSQRDAALGEVFAPGAFIEGARPGGGVAILSGTSMAAPVIAGVAALADQLAMQTLGRLLTLAEFRFLLAATGVAITDDGSSNVRDTGLTYRRVDVESLAEGVLSLIDNPIPSDPVGSPSQTGDTIFHAADLPPGEQEVSLDAGSVVTGIDFGNFRWGTISGTVSLR